MAISKSRLTQLRMTGEGPPFIKIATRAVAYRKSDLDAWLDNRVRRTTPTSRKHNLTTIAP